MTCRIYPREKASKNAHPRRALFADHVGKKRVLLAACGLMAAGAATWTLAVHLFAACLGGLLMGAGGGIIESMSSTVLSDLFPDRRKFFLNFSQVVYCAGAVAGPLVMGWLLPLGTSWRVCFAGIAIAALVLLALYSTVTLPVPPREERVHFAAVRKMIRRRSFVMPCLALFFYVLIESGVILYGNAYLQTVHQAPERWAILFLSVFWVGMIAGRWICACIPERVPYAPLTAALLTGSAATLVLQQWAGRWVPSLVYFALTGFLFSGIWPLIIGLSASSNSRYSGTVLGVTIAAGSLGAIAAPSLFNILFGGLPASVVFPVAALPLLAAALVVLSAGEVRKEPVQDECISRTGPF